MLFVKGTARIKTFRKGKWQTTYSNRGEIEVLEEYKSFFGAWIGHRFWVGAFKNGDLD